MFILTSEDTLTVWAQACGQMFRGRGKNSLEVVKGQPTIITPTNTTDANVYASILGSDEEEGEEMQVENSLEKV